MTSTDKIAFMLSRYGTGKQGEKCKDCSHCKPYQRGNHSLYKCDVYGVSMSAATDWKVSNQACGIFNKPCEDRNVYLLTRKGKPLTTIDGQMELEI